MSVTQFPFPHLRQADPPDDLDAFAKLLLENEWVTPDHLDQAMADLPRTGASLDQTLIARGWADPENIAAATADCWNLGYANLLRDPPDRDIARPENLDLYLKYKILPWRRIGKMMAYVTADPNTAKDALGQLEPDHGMAFFLVASRPGIDQALMDLFELELAERAATHTPGPLSVRTLGIQRYGLLAGILGVAAIAIASTDHALAMIGFLLLILSVVTTTTRLASIAYSRKRPPPELAPMGTVALADHRPLPSFSILVPLYREASMVSRISRSLDQLDYPRERLDVKLLLEAGDTETIQAARQADLPPWITAVVMPDGAPRTKPRAMNLALDFCDGDIVGIFDAEDHPDPDQLKTVAEHFRAAAPEVACVQCQLAFFNARENWVTRCFQIEYAIWFDVLLRGWERLGLPVPLGGTSVYFRASALRDLGGWDAHNVTEDADLGMRLARRGLKTAVVTSTTQEEANCQMLPWIRQRSRWLKGYMITWLCHMRDPRALLRDLGPAGFFGFQVLFLGGAASYLAMPLFWAALMLTILTQRSVYGPVMPDWTVTALGVSLLLGQLVMLGSAALALQRRRLPGLTVWVPTLILYWTMGAAAAWKAVIELVFAPYYWDKTKHGLSKVEGPKQKSP